MNTKKTFTFLGAALFMFNVNSKAQDSMSLKKNLSLQDALEMGMQNSKSIRISNSKINEAIANYDDAKMGRLPDASASGGYYRINKPKIDLKFPTSSSDGSSSGTTIPNVNSLMYGMVTANYTIFAGGKIKNNIKAANFLKNASQFDLQRDKEEIAENIVEAYYSLYKSQAAVKLVRENLATAQKRVKDFVRLEQNGIVAKNDLLKVQLQESNMELSLLDAENQEKVLNYNFNLLIGLNDATKVATDSIDMTKFPNADNANALEQAALTNRGDIKALLEREQAAQTQIDLAKSDKLPSIGLTGGYIAMDVPHAMSITNALNLGVGVKYDIGSLYKNKTKVKQAQAQVETLKWNQAALEDNIKSQIFTNIQNYIEALKKLEVYQTAIQQADENYRVTKNKYDNSLATTTDLLDADVAKLKANIDFEYGKADAIISYNKINESAGTIISKYNLDNK
ncbi:TolC family protein [Rhizosphaericola mali]|nr:TolC family protein [Rhizosphaericola mali]